MTPANHDHSDWRKRFIAYYLKNSYRTLLDVSAGDGRFAEYYKWLGLSVNTTERDAIACADLIAKGFTPCFYDLDCRESLAELVNDYSVHVVTCTEVIEHLDDPRGVVESLVRIPKHLTIITTPVGKSYLSPDHKHHWNDEKHLRQELLSDVDGSIIVEQFPTKMSDVKSLQKSFLIAIYKD